MISFFSNFFLINLLLSSLFVSDDLLDDVKTILDFSGVNDDCDNGLPSTSAASSNDVSTMT